MIIMGDFAQSILGGVMLQRLRTVLAEFGIEEQMGFTKNRSTVDAIFTLLQAVAKRRLHGQDTWMAFIDLRSLSIGAVDALSVSEKFGIPSHFRQVLQRSCNGPDGEGRLGSRTRWRCPLQDSARDAG